MIKKASCYLFVLVLFCQCIPVKEEVITEVNLDLNDPELRKIYDLQDQRNTDSLYNWFRHKNPTYRYAATMAFASVQDKRALDSLAILLNDKVDQVRIAAAYAIGQLKDQSAQSVLVNAFQKNDSLSNSNHFNRAILESVGKCAASDYLKPLSTISTYEKKDIALLEGQALGIYRYALRNITSPESTQKMLHFLSEPGYTESVKLIAANYLARGQNLQLDSLAAPIIIGFNQSSDPRTQMALAIALGKTKDPNALGVLIRELIENHDYRVKCNAIRAFGNFEYNAVRTYVLDALKHKNPHVAIVAAQFFVDHGVGSDAEQYWQIAKDTSLDWQVRMILLRAANKHLPYYMEVTRGRINQELRNKIQRDTNPYEKGAALLALSEYGWNYRFIHEQGVNASDPIVKTASADALAFIASSPTFDRFFGFGKRRVKRDLSGYFVEAVKSGDPAQVAIAAEVIGNPDLDYKSVIDSSAFLEKALAKLSLPKEIETYNKLQAAIDYFKGSPKREPKTPDYNHPIDWLVLEALEEDTKVIIEIGDGSIILQLFPEKAPGSVGNFVQLAKNGFF